MLAMRTATLANDARRPGRQLGELGRSDAARRPAVVVLASSRDLRARHHMGARWPRGEPGREHRAYPPGPARARAERDADRLDERELSPGAGGRRARLRTPH